MTTANHVALGFRVHSGWAAVVALLDSPRLPEVIKRCRIELVEPGAPGGVQPYHAARNLDSRDAEQFIARVLEAADRAALKSIDALNEDLRGQGGKVIACGVVLASGRALPSLDVTMKSHALVHTAEGELFRSAIAHAAKRYGWKTLGIKEKELYELAAKQLRISVEKLKLRVTEMGRALGSPWSADEKSATLAAWLSLRASQ
ncbi:MAG TPA: hypothetical protein VGU63_07370 [Candidatus Acidoferrales bacterium]|nr:hypothetical protein [Candidatus Acidoferrales bacterium]